ncbi:hypothetical protein, partial [Spartinivicinus poritis]
LYLLNQIAILFKYTAANGLGIVIIRNIFETYVEKNKPLAVYFSKKFIQDSPMFLSKFNSLVPTCI